MIDVTAPSAFVLHGKCRIKSPICVEWPVDHSREALGHTITGHRNQLHLHGYAGFEPHSCTGGDVQFVAPRSAAIELERWVGFEEVRLATHLDVPVAAVDNGQRQSLGGGEQLDRLVADDDLPWADVVLPSDDWVDQRDELGAVRE